MSAHESLETPEATCDDCGHPAIKHYATKMADPTGRAYCGEHLGCEICEAATYCQGYCPPNSQPIDPDEAAAGATVCDDCSDEMDSRARDAYGRRYH